MQPYGPHARSHGVVAYEIGDDSLDVEFTSGWIYRFSYQRTGAPRVERMKALAQSGRGLSTFINRFVRNRYQSKRRKEDGFSPGIGV